MRKEPYSVGSYVHVIKRGNKGMSIVRDDSDRIRFLLMLSHFNDKQVSDNWYRELSDFNNSDPFKRPPIWPKQDKIVKILGFCLLDNHFHLLLEEIVDGGISKFMKKIGVGMSGHFNEKYKETGSLFQGAFRSRTISDDRYFRYVSVYVQLKNCFEMYPGGFKKACSEFNKAFSWACKYPYSSLGHYFCGHLMSTEQSGVVDTSLLKSIFSEEEYKVFAKDFLEGRGDLKNISQETKNEWEFE